MVLDHIGIVNKSEEEALRFYRDILGLDKIKDSVSTADLSEQLFSISRDIKMVVFGKGSVKVEVFIFPGFSHPSPNIPHLGIQVKDFEQLLERAKQAGVKVITGKRGDKTVYFIQDFSENLIELKPG
ncbi:MAG: VOC family protein [Nitrospirae bacterium]|nr:VOC family protein [Nitrospirota bacterium]